MAQLEPGHFFLGNVINVFDSSVGHELDLVVFLGALQHDLRSTEFIAAMNYRNLGREAGQEERLLHRRVSATNHRNFFPGEEKPIASGARGDSVANQSLLVRQSQPPSRSATGDDNRLRLHLVFAHLQAERTLAEVRSSHMRQLVFGAEAFGLTAHVSYQLGTLNPLGKSRKVFHQRSQ